MKRPLLFAALFLLTTAAGAQPPAAREVRPSAGSLAGRALYSNSHALLIGISRYRDLPPAARLQFAHRDALDLRDVLIRNYGFPAENITLLIDEQATKAAIEKALAAYADSNRIGRNDRILLFFSGHGQTVTLPDTSEMGFLVPYDARIDLTRPDNAGPYLDTCVEMDGLWKYLRACPAKHALVMADACFSGLLAQSRALDGARIPANELVQHASRPARQVLTAGGKGEVAFEDASLGHGAFTYKLLEELRAHAALQGEVFTASELASRLKRTVSKLTGGKQTPTFGNYRTEGEFLFVPSAPRPVPPVVSNLPGVAGPTPAEAASELATLINGSARFGSPNIQVVRSDSRGFTLRTRLASPDAPVDHETELNYADLDLGLRLFSSGVYVVLRPRPGRTFMRRNLSKGGETKTDRLSLFFRTEEDTDRCILLLRRAAGLPVPSARLAILEPKEREAAARRLQEWVNSHCKDVNLSQPNTSISSEVTLASPERLLLREVTTERANGAAHTTTSEYRLRLEDVDWDRLGLLGTEPALLSIAPVPGRSFSVHGSPAEERRKSVTIAFPSAANAETFVDLLFQTAGHRAGFPLTSPSR